MASLYSISEDLLRIFDELEANGGEITPEGEELLNIKENELKEKLDDYRKAILSWKSDIDDCKKEEDRIKGIRKFYEKRIDRLQSSMLNAVLQFGEVGKTNKFIELPTCRLYTRKSESVEVKEERVKNLVYLFDILIRELNSQGILYTGQDIDIAGFLDTINANAKAEFGEDYEPYNEMDLYDLKVAVTFRYSIVDLMADKNSILKEYTNTPNVCIKSDTCKEDFKEAIISSIEAEAPVTTLANIKVNQNLQIR